jgi:uncharacterized protein (TIGR02646 family)
MHWVERGPEPQGLESMRSHYTPRWVDHYRDGVGSRPTDSRWRDFRDDLGSAFFRICAYCEESCPGEVDHFRPKSRFPELVYEWPNWVFACRACNGAKGEKWPSGGYIDPCARSRAARPEVLFDFNTTSGTVIPNVGLSPARRKKATQTIDDLQLNADHHVQWRLTLLRAIEQSLPGSAASNPGVSEYLEWATDRSRPLSSITRKLLSERG